MIIWNLLLSAKHLCGTFYDWKFLTSLLKISPCISVCFPRILSDVVYSIKRTWDQMCYNLQMMTIWNLLLSSPEEGKIWLDQSMMKPVPSEDSDQSAPPHSLIRVFTVSSKESPGSRVPLYGQWRLIRLGQTKTQSRNAAQFLHPFSLFCWFQKGVTGKRMCTKYW